jgi:hypothetical protein
LPESAGGKKNRYYNVINEKCNSIGLEPPTARFTAAIHRKVKL